MLGRGRKNIFRLTISMRKLSVLIFALFFSWMLAFPFEGQILYALSHHFHLNPHNIVFGSIVAQFIGLLVSGFFIKTMKATKRLMLFSIAFCIIGSSIFFFDPSILWGISLISCSFLAGTCVAAWGFLFKFSTPSYKRIQTAADSLIYSNLIMILLNSAAIYLSPYIGLGLSIFVLCVAGFFSLQIPSATVETQLLPTPISNSDKHPIIAKPLAFLCLFIVTITINSGLMYQVLNPAFAHHGWLVGWYWAIPYIVTLYIMKNLSNKANRTYLLYVAIAMIGFSFIAFITFDRSVPSYLLVNTLMLGACGIFDLFWWSILGEMLSLDKNPAKILGIGLSANVLGVLLGGMLGNVTIVYSDSGYYSSMFALVVVCITLILLPPLHKYLSLLLENHVYLTVFSETSATEKDNTIKHFTRIGQLTERESEIAALLLEGKTYRKIAEELFVSENTIKTHVKNIYSKCSIQSRAELIHLMLDGKSDHK